MAGDGARPQVRAPDPALPVGAARLLVGVPALVATLGLVASACAGSEVREAAARCRRGPQQQNAPPGVQTCRTRAQVDVRVDGAASVRDRGARRTVVVQFFGGSLPQASWFVAMQLEEPVPAGEGRTYRLGFQLAPGRFRGPGRYVLQEGQGPARDDVFVDLVEGGRAVQFRRIRRPCRLSVGELALEGALDCPELAAEGGAGQVSMRLRWRAA